jgi:ketosteroid isomerase-like protein
MLSTSTHALQAFQTTHVLTGNESFIEHRGDDSMKATRLAIVLMGALAMLRGAAASADSTVDQNTVAALDTEYQLAVKNNDADTMARILSDEFVLILGTGQTYTKTDLLNKARTKEVLYEQNEDTDKTVRVWGDNAVVTSKLWLKGVDKGKRFEWHVWFSDTYVRTPSGWRYVNGFASLPVELLRPSPTPTK